MLTWLNSWDRLSGDQAAQVSITVNDEVLVDAAQQSIRIDNIWESTSTHVTFTATEGSPVEVVFTPSGGNGKVYLNGFEIDSPAIGNQVSFPTPAHRDERVELGDATTVTASWRQPADLTEISYNVYYGTASDSLEVVAEGLTEASAELEADLFGTFYWRVDVVSGETVYPGRVFWFRAASLAFPGAEGWG